MSDNPSREPTPREKLERLKVLARRAPAFYRGALVISTVVFVLGIISILRMPRIYQSEAVVLVRDAIRPDPKDDSARIHVQRLGPKIKDLLLARSRLERIILELGLYEEEIERFGMVEAVEEMRLQIGFRARDSDMFVISFQSTDRELSQNVTARLTESMIEEFVRDNVSRMTVARDFLAEEEKRAERELEEKARAFAEFLADNPQFAWDPTRGFPGTMMQLPGMGQALSPAPAQKLPNDPELASLYRERARLEERLSGGSSVGAVDREELQLLEEARSKAEVALAQAQAELSEKRQKLTEEHPDLIATRNRVITAGRVFGEADAALSRARARLGSRSPAASGVGDPKLREQLAAVKSAISARERTLANNRSKAKSAPPMPTSEGWGAVELETEWQRLVREVSEARNRKEDVAAKRSRAELAASATLSSGSMLMTIIDPAYLPLRPIKPKRMVLGLMTMGLSGMLGVLWAFTRVLLDDLVFDAIDIEAKGGPEVLVSIPRDPVQKSARSLVLRRRRASAASSERPKTTRAPTVTPTPETNTPPRRLASTTAQASALVVQPDRKSSIVPSFVQAPTAESEEEPEVVEVIGFASPREVQKDGELPIIGLRAIAALRILRYRIEQRAVDGRMAVCITSAVPGEGKSRLAVQLALALVESDRARVLLVEGNLEQPALARLLGVEIPAEQGFSMQLRRRAIQGHPEPWKVMACGGSLHLLAENPNEPTWPGMLHSRELTMAIHELRPRYDYIIIDGPSILGEGGATSVERAVNGFVMVARARVTRGSALLRGARMLGQKRLFGVVLTDVEEES